MPVFEEDLLVVLLHDVKIPSRNSPAEKYMVIRFIIFNVIGKLICKNTKLVNITNVFFLSIYNTA